MSSENAKAFQDLMESMANNKSHNILQQFEAAADTLSGRMLRLNSALSGFTPDDLIGVVLSLRRDDTNLLFQVKKFEEASSHFIVENILDSKDSIEVSQNLMRKAPIMFHEKLSAFRSQAQVDLLPVKTRMPRGAMYVDLAPNRPISIAIVDSQGEEINRAVSTEVFGLSAQSSASGELEAAGSRSHPIDPMKHQAIQRLSPATSAIFTGKYESLTTNFQYLYDCVLNGGFEVENGILLLNIVMWICIPKMGCVLFLKCVWIGLYHFRDMGSNSHYLEKEHASIACPKSEWSTWSVEVVEECWNNCLRLLNRVFKVSAEFERMWNDVWIALRMMKVHQIRYFPGLAIGSIVYEITDTMARNLFLMIGRPGLTETQLTEALTKFTVSDQNTDFLRTYALLEKEYERSLQKRVVIEVDSNNNRDENPLKKQKKEKERQKEKEKKVDKEKKNKGKCFSFLSQGGCSTVGCHFSHTPMSESSDNKKKRAKEMIVARGLVPDESKF